MATKNYDVVIIGGSFGGVAAALAAASDPRVSVVLLESSAWIGGQATSQGVTRWDEAGMQLIETVGSTKSYRDLRNAIRHWYAVNAPVKPNAPSLPFFNPGWAGTGNPFSADPHIVHMILKGLVAKLAPQLAVQTGETIVSMEIESGSVKSVEAASGTTYTGHVFLDATDLGDLLPLAKINWTIGAEAQSDTGEAAADPQPHPDWVQPITVPIAVEHRPAGENHTIPRPANFDDIARSQGFKLVDGDINGVFKPLPSQPPGYHESLFGYRQYIDPGNFNGGDYANSRTTLNVGSNDLRDVTLPGKIAADSLSIYNRARAVSVAFLYWLQTECARDDGSGQGYPNVMVREDAFGTADGCAPQAYIRESRRIDAEVRVVQHDIEKTDTDTAIRATNFTDSCGIGYYGIDVHQLHNGMHAPQLATRRFQVPLGALLPKELDNFVAACKNIGTTHVTSGAYRVHPVEWAIGEAAGVLAAMSKLQNVSPKTIWQHDDWQVAYQYRLLARGAPIFWWSDILLEDDPKTYAAAHLCGAKGILTGDQALPGAKPTEEEIDVALRFDPGGPVTNEQREALSQRVGKDLPWPGQAMTRGQTAIFICEQMGWPTG